MVVQESKLFLEYDVKPNRQELKDYTILVAGAKLDGKTSQQEVAGNQSPVVPPHSALDMLTAMLVRCRGH